MRGSSRRRATAVRTVLVASAVLAAACEQGPTTPPPRLTALAPSRVQSGQSVVLQGTGFAAEPGLNAVYFGNARARVEAATTTELRVQVPEIGIASVEAARVAVRVVVAGLESDSLELDVLPGAQFADGEGAHDGEAGVGVWTEEVPEEGPPPGAPARQASADPGPSAPRAQAPPATAASGAASPRPEPTAAPPTRPAPVPKATPAPKPPPPKKEPAPAPAPKPTPAPDPELAQARKALADGDPQTALRLFAAVLERSPDDAEAAAGREQALEEIGNRRSLVTGETRTTAAPAAGAAPAGFASDDVEVGAQAPPARIGFEIRPERVEPGAPWRLAIFLANDSDDRLTVKSLAAEIRENGKRKAMAPALRTSRVGGGAREQVGELAGAWGASLEQWSVEVTVLSDDGDRYVCRLSWK